MADFAAVLKRTLEKMDDASPDIRAKVYDKARDTVRKQIAAMEKAPPQAAIDRQFEKLEQAISSVEGEFSQPEDVLGLDDLLDEVVSDEVTEQVDEVVADPVDEVEPETVEAEADVVEPEVTVEEPVVDETPVAEPEPVEEVVETAPSSRVDELRARAKKNMARMEAEQVAEVTEVASDTTDPLADFINESTTAVENADISIDTAVDDIKASADIGDIVGEVKPELPSVSSVIDDPLGDLGLDTPAPMQPETSTGGGFMRLLKVLLVAGILGGGGYYAYGHQGEIKSWWSTTLVPWWQDITKGTSDTAADVKEPQTDEGDSGVPVRKVTTTTIENTGEAQNEVENINNVEPKEKFTQRLNEDGTEIDEGPAEGANLAAPPAEGSSVAEQTSGSQEPQVEENQTEAEPAAPAAATTPVGQRAIFYEERTGAQDGTALSGATVWSVVNESPGGDLPVEPAIRAETSVPELGLKMEMTIRRNGDSTFPASHIIELFFRVPDSFEGRGIADVQRVTFKSVEQDPGNALIAVPAPLDQNIFLIALTDAATAIDTNINLMKRENWIDIPMQYTSGRRALITFEKGIPGERVFDEVFAAWDAAPIN